MRFDVTPSISYLKDNFIREDGTSSIPFWNEIQNIYYGYRQCWSKNIYAEAPITDEKKQELREALKESLRKTHLPHKPFYPNIGTLTEENLDKFINYRIKEYGEEQYYIYLKRCLYIKNHLHHLSPTEHGSLSVQISGVSRAMTHQLVRHRIASYSHQSQRYVPAIADEIAFITPKSIARNEKAKACYEKFLLHFGDYLSEMEEIKKEDPSIINEDIRFAYPNAMPTEIVVTFNFRVWMHFFNERCCNRAQWEIRQCANSVLEYFQDYIPFVFDDEGPKCLKNKMCPETDSCGRFPRIEEVIKLWAEEMEKRKASK